MVNIRGCNGSGKSTIPMQMMEKDPDFYVLYSETGKKKAIATVFPNLKWVALGTYFNKTGGMDVFPNNEYTKQALKRVWNEFPDYNILLEGIIASTIKSTYAKLFKEFNAKFTQRKVIILNIVTPVEVCLARIQERNGGIPINEKLVKDKWDIVNRNIGYFREEGFTSIRLDNSTIPKAKALKKFLKFCSHHESEEKSCESS